MTSSYLLISAVLLAAPAAVNEPTTSLKVDQVGYPQGAPKLAFVVSENGAWRFVVRRAESGAAAFEGRLGAAVADPDSGDRVRAADFSRLEQPGRYFLDVPGVGRSWEFAVGPRPYGRALYLAMRGYYGQRCGTAVDLGAQFPGYSHAACHAVGAFHASSGKAGPRASTRGWHDAGDYGRYVVNSGISTGTLLWAVEMFPTLEELRLDIPESGDGTPDVLNEVRWNLDWMLSMQDDDGGVWQKQTSEKFPEFVLPEQDDMPSVVVGTGAAPFKSSCASADFAAVMAVAGRVYRRYDADFAGRSLAAARNAWAWLQVNPDVVFKNPPGIVTGEYGDGDCGDERLWAAAELWRSTGEAAYEGYFLGQRERFLGSLEAARPEGWAELAPMGLWTYVLGGGKDAAAVASIRDATLRAADRAVARARSNGYRITLTAGDYVWGSNGVAANQAMALLVADAFQRDRRYLDAVLDDLHYLLGRNTFSLSWVTQVGANPFRHPHHRPSGADANPEPWPGLLSGGPNRSRQDPVLEALPAGLPPARMYRDDQASYASNEIAINWNAPLVFVLGGIQGR